MNKTDILSLYEKTLNEISKSQSEYYRFLELAGRLPKYSFQNQVLIYGHNPQASACATQSVWEKTMRHKMKSIVSPIYTLGDDEEPEVVYDISDMDVIPNVSRQLPTWSVNVSDRKEYFDALVKEYPLADNAYELSDSMENDIEQFAFSIIVEEITEKATDFDEVKYLSLVGTAGITKVVTSACNLEMRNRLTKDHLTLTGIDRNTAEAMGELINEKSLDILSVIRAKSREIIVTEAVPDPADKNVSPPSPPKLNISTESSFDEKTTIVETSQNELFLLFENNPWISVEVVDTILRQGGKARKSTQLIAIHYSKDYGLDENVTFLKKQYENIGQGINAKGEHYAAWFDNEGMLVAKGDTALDNYGKVRVPWNMLASRIGTLLEKGEYLTGAEIEELSDLEISNLSTEAIYFIRDIPTKDKYFGDSYSSGIFGNNVNEMKESFYDAEKYDQLIYQLESVTDAVSQDPSIMRFRFYKPANVLKNVKGYADTKFQWKSNTLAFPSVGSIITEDEINYAIRGGASIENSKMRIYGAFIADKNKKTRTAYLKNYYGIGGHSHALGGKDSAWEDHDGKGLKFSIGDLTNPTDEVLLSWSNVEKRISHMMDKGNYLTPEQLEHYESNREKFALKSQALPILDEELSEELSEEFIDDDFEELPTIKQMAVEVQNTQISFFDEAFQLEQINEAIIREKSARPRTVEPEIVNLLDKEVDPAPNIIPLAVIENDVTTELIIGETVMLDNREFVVESISDFGRVSLRDETFKEEMGFPIFRSEKLELVEYALEKQAKLVNQISEEIAGEDFNENPPPELFEKIGLLAGADSSERKAIDYSSGKNFSLSENHFTNRNNRQKVTDNLEALELLRELELDGRTANETEQEKLAGFIGWGGLPEVFDEREGKSSLYSSERERLKNLLSESEYKEAKASTLTAHYTPKVVIDTIYEALGRFGFKGGNILDPALGSGNFFGCMPEDIKTNSILYGVEIDSTTSSLAKQLYPETNIINAGFEKTSFPDNFFDVGVGNVPFGNYSVNDTRYNRHKLMIHDYFFMKSLDKLHAGGIMAFVTSKGTMDKESANFRKMLAEQADLLGAIRLPNTAFKSYAGTEVTSDILFFQKRDTRRARMPEWVYVAEVSEGLCINKYFADNPDMVLGEMALKSGPFGPESTCNPYDGIPLDELLSKAVLKIKGEFKQQDFSLSEEKESIIADPTVRNYSYTMVGDSIYYRENGLMYPTSVNERAMERIEGLITLRNVTRNLISAQMGGEPYETFQAELNEVYDSFVKKNGRINSRGNSLAFCEDSSYPLLCSLEVEDAEGKFLRKADMFSKQTIRPVSEVLRADTVSEGIAISLNQYDHISIEDIMRLTEKSEEDVIRELTGSAFINPITSSWESAEEYLSGYVRDKLNTAIHFAKDDERFNVNVTALEKVQPKDLDASEIEVNIGATWIDKNYVQQFMEELFELVTYDSQKVEYSDHTGEWFVSNKNWIGSPVAKVTYGTERANGLRLLEDALNLRSTRIYDTHYVDGKEVKKINQTETILAEQKQQLIKDQFKNWVFKDSERRRELCRIYNDKFNSIRPRVYDGSHLTFAGINPEISLRPHQLNAIARAVYGGNTLLAHAVGAGKTYEVVAIAMKSKQLGLCNKSLIVVPNHITEQWGREFMELFPSANILVATKKDFTPDKRKRFCSRIATGDYDAVVIGHSQFAKIPLSEERQAIMIEEQINSVVTALENLKNEEGGNGYSIKQLESTKKNLETRLEKLNDSESKDDVITFEELGVDRLFIDESHEFKNLFIYTKMRNIAGIGQSQSQKAMDLFMKCRYIDELTGNRGNIHATGTPISNSMSELYTNMRYLAYDTLSDLGLSQFDSWASTYGQTVNETELAPEGTGYRTKTRFSRFYNLPELMNIFTMFADVQTEDMLNLPVPKAEYIDVTMDASDYQADTVSTLADRAGLVRQGAVKPHEDNMLNITNDGRKLALDQRLVSNNGIFVEENPDGKTTRCAENIFSIWKNTKSEKLTQLVFCDLSTPKGDGSFNVYEDIKTKLMEKDIPEQEIEFIHNAKTDKQRDELFAKMRTGAVRILLGSTPKMGTGTNIQKRLVALHHLDVPWRPSDIAQREGRILRQGNMNDKAKIYRYITKGTFDAYSWQIIEKKQKFIGQIMTSKSPARSCEDVDATALSYAEVKALATGNPLIKEKMDLDIRHTQLRLAKANYDNQRFRMQDNIEFVYPAAIKACERRVANLEQDIELRDVNRTENFNAIVNGKSYDKRKDAGEMLSLMAKSIRGLHGEKLVAGKYLGFKLEVSDCHSTAFNVTLIGSGSYSTEVSHNGIGIFQSIESLLSSLEKSKDKSAEELTKNKSNLEYAETHVDEPFKDEDELKAVTERLTELNYILSQDNKVVEKPTESEKKEENEKDTAKHRSVDIEY